MTQFVVYQDIDYEPGLVPYQLRAKYTAALERFCIKRADLVCSIGSLLAARRRNETGRDVHVIPNGVEWDIFSTSRDTNILGHDLVFVGNVFGWAGLEHAIQALPGIREAFPDARLLIIGDGLPAYIEGLKTLARTLGLDGYVVFMGLRRPEELPALLAGASIGLANSKPIPFRKYACPLKVMEYMAAGLPVIATRGTETEEMLKRYDCGVSVDHDFEQLKKAVLHMLSNPDASESMRSNGIAASKELTWARLVTQEMDLVRDICSSQRTTSA
jgi:glycosyltransferase involved in cell wall biosynthesis